MTAVIVVVAVVVVVGGGQVGSLPPSLSLLLDGGRVRGVESKYTTSSVLFRPPARCSLPTSLVTPTYIPWH